MAVMVLIYRLILVAALITVLCFVYAPLVANVVAATAQYADDKEEVYRRVLEWQPDHKEALSQLAVISLQKQEYQEAVELAKQAIQADPTNGRAMSVLITAYDALNKPEEAERALQLATKLWPSHAFVRIQSADFWAKRGDMQKTLSEWSVLLARHTGFHKELFPILKALVETEEYQPLLKPYYEEPALWWKSFFIYLTRQDVALETIVGFYQKRIASKSEISPEERNAYVARLLKEKQWRLAYSSWMGGLDEKERQHVSLVYDGSFEALTKPSAFSWNYGNKAYARIRLNRIRGAKGQKAFKLDFKKTKPITAPVLRQRLMLQEGKSYKLSFIAQLMSLKNPQGLEWSVRCESERNSIASSEPLTGREKKAEYDFEFFVPEGDCRTQILELKPVSRFHHERFFQGAVWFDEISIKPILKKGQDDE